MTDEIQTRPAEPRLRVGAMVWGVIVCIASATTLAIVAAPQRREAVLDWLLDLTPSSVGVLAIVAVGGVMLLLGLVSVLRHRQND